MTWAGPVHYLDSGGPAVVCAHGLAGPAVNWPAIAPLLAGACRMPAVGLPGHGLTPRTGAARACRPCAVRRS